MIATSLPYWPINPNLSPSPWFNFQLDLVRCLWAVLPAAILWGASFPLALAGVAESGRDPGRLVGGVYAANTVGAIIGAGVSSLLLISWLGTQQSQRVLIGVSAVAGLLMLLPSLWPLRSLPPTAPRFRELALRIGSVAGVVALVAGTALLAWTVSTVPWELVAYGRSLLTNNPGAKILYVGEGMNSSVAVTKLSNDALNFHVSGKIEASTEPQDMRLQRMLGHLPALVHPKPRSVLVVGCGAGVTAGSFVVHPDVERIVICEIEPLIPRVVAGYFAQENYNVVHDPRVEVVYDDARHYILTTAEKFDIITSDPIHPWVKGAATLYTKEYFELCRRHLNPGGLVTQWVPLYESDTNTVKSEIATFMEVFGNGTIWSNPDTWGKGYDTVLLGQAEATRIDVDAIQQRLNRADHARVARSLQDVGFHKAVDLFGTYAGQGPDLKPWLENAQINRDRNLRLQYLAGMGLNYNHGEYILLGILKNRRFPEELFIASKETKKALERRMEPPTSDQ
jgi:spermidine synthase